MIDSTFKNVIRLFVPSFKLGINMDTRNTFKSHCLPLLEIKVFNVLINNEPFIDQFIKTNKECMKYLSKCQEMVTIQQETY